MTDMDLEMRTAARQRRWRRLGRLVSGSLGVAAVVTAVYLGVTGPLVSPVQPAAAAVAAADPAPMAADENRDIAFPDQGPRDDRRDAFGFGRRR